MERLNTIASMRDFVHNARQGGAGRGVSFVPTMGALHDGHRACVDVARKHGDVLVVSIFLNPTQFAPGEDLDKYPADRDRDLELCRSWGCDVVFTPTVKEMYPEPQTVWVEPGDLAEPLCGRSRPGHFRGVATVVAKLFTAVDPDVAVFGQKDAQQALIIRAMVRQLGFPVALKLAPTVREKDGLAISSRNAYLSAGERALAPAFHRALERGQQAVAAGERDPAAVVSTVDTALDDAGVREVEYVELLDTKSLKAVDRVSGRVILAGAVRIGATRLIDNIVLDVTDAGTQAVLLY